MEGVRIERVSKRKNSVEHYHRLYAILKSVLPEYVGVIEKIEHSNTPNLHSHALFLEEHVVGGYLLTDNGDEAYLAFIGLTENMRGKGLGKLLIGDASKKAFSWGRDRIRIDTVSEKVPRFKRIGFKEYFPGDKGKVELYLDV